MGYVTSSSISRCKHSPDSQGHTPKAAQSCQPWEGPFNSSALIIVQGGHSAGATQPCSSKAGFVTQTRCLQLKHRDAACTQVFAEPGRGSGAQGWVWGSPSPGVQEGERWRAQRVLHAALARLNHEQAGPGRTRLGDTRNSDTPTLPCAVTHPSTEPAPHLAPAPPASCTDLLSLRAGRNPPCPSKAFSSPTLFSFPPPPPFLFSIKT